MLFHNILKRGLHIERSESTVDSIILVVMVILTAIPCLLFLLALVSFILHALTTGIN